MARPLIVCALLAAALPVRADDPPPTVIRITAAPAAAPKPSLKYLLLPELKEMNPGNPVPAYLKCFMEQNNFFHKKESVENREKWQTAPLNELPLQELRNYGGSALRQADYAARLDTPDWQALIPIKRDGINTLIPEVQQIRMLAAALKVRFRAEVAENRFDDAIRTAKTIFALSRHMAEYPCLISDLVGFAIANLAIGPLEEMIGQPGSPNLYWALTSLPAPFIDIRKGLEAERLTLDKELGEIPDQRPMTPAELRRVFDRSKLLLDSMFSNNDPKDIAGWIAEKVKDADHMTAAQKRLAESGLDADRLKTFPPEQVVLLDERRDFEVRRDEVMRGLMLPYPQAERAAGAAGEPVKVIGPNLYAHMAPIGLKIRRVSARLDQRIALLRVVEAVRMYAAEHGKPPASLDDVTVPLPDDPFTGKPFKYEADEMRFRVIGTPPKVEAKTPGYNVRYEVTLTK